MVFFFCGAPSLTRGRVFLLYMPLTLASVVFLGSESLGTRDHILLSQISDFPFRRYLRLAGSRWRYRDYTLPSDIMVNKCRAICGNEIEGGTQGTRKRLFSVTIFSPQIKLGLANFVSSFTKLIHINVLGILFIMPYKNYFIFETD
jgi:hypothetical protein